MTRPTLTAKARQLVGYYERPRLTEEALELVAAVEASKGIEKRLSEREKRSSGGTRTKAGSDRLRDNCQYIQKLLKEACDRFERERRGE